jgi:uncharacterized protein (DUF1800 family)
MKKRRMVAAILLCAASATVPAIVDARRTETTPPDEDAIVHVLNRLGYGPRPGDVQAVRRMGLDRYIDRQLHPESIPDPGISVRLDGLSTLSLGSREIAARYELPVQRARAERRKDAAEGKPADSASARRTVSPEARQANLPLMELSEQKILRSVYSERQLEEVLTDFWFNHFNVDARKGPVRFMLTSYERDVIRPHVLGRFRDLLGAVAESPAMLFYLDNWMSTDPSRPRSTSSRRGLNENYGRELLELHTLGVDGGYTQHDVTEVARAFTGWTIDRPRQGGGFRFAPALHDAGDKIVLGQRIDAGGTADGERVLAILARNPATARTIAAKLSERFVSDTPPAALVEHLSSVFLSTDGDLRAVMSALLRSPEFRSPDGYGDKIKTPLEFVVSALRATGAEITDARPIVAVLRRLGMPLYQCQPPTGYSATAAGWVNAGALIDRMNVALALARGSMKGVAVSHVPDPTSLIAGGASEATRMTIARAGTPAQAAALALGSPEFQRR